MRKSLTLCILAPEFIPIWGGAGSYTTQLLENLPRNLDIHVITPRRLLNGAKGVNHGEIPHFGDNIRIHYVSEAKDTFIYNARFQFSCLGSFPKLNKEFNFDLIHSHHAHMPDILLNLSRVVNIPTVTTVHNILEWMRASILKQDIPFNKLDQSEKGIISFYSILRSLERYNLRRAQALISPSEVCKKALIDSFGISPDKVHLIYNGVDTNVFNSKNFSKEMFQFAGRPIVLFVGRFVAQKGLATLAKAMPQVVNHVRNVLFVFVGQGDFSYLKSQIERHGTSSRSFVNIGFLSYSEIHKIYPLAEVFVLPSPHENCSLSLLEAMSCERAVIAANVGGNREIIRSYHNGVLFSSQNSEELAAKIVQLLEDTALQRKLGIQARKTVVERFSIQSMAAETTKVYNTVLQNRI